MNKDILLSCRSKSEVCEILGISNGGKGMKKVNEFLLEYGLPLDLYKKNKFNTIEHKCKECGKDLPSDKKRNSFCNKSCSASFNNKRRKKILYNNTCKNCGKM